MDPYFRILGMSKCFSGFSREDMKQFMAISSNTFWPAGENIFLEGDSGQDMFIIFSGKIGIWRDTPAGRLSLAILGPGESFGEMALIGSGPRGASARTMEDTVALHVDHERLGEAPGAASLLYRNIARELAERLNDANNVIIFKSLLDSPSTSSE